MNYSTAILRYPSGRYGLVGSVPEELAWQPAAGSLRVPRTWDTENEVIRALLAEGITHFQLADCSWYQEESHRAWQTKLAEIQRHLDTGGVIQIVTYAKATQYTRKHRELFTADAAGLYVRRGRSKDCLNFTTIRFGRYV